MTEKVNIVGELFPYECTACHNIVIVSADLKDDCPFECPVCHRKRVMPRQTKIERSVAPTVSPPIPQNNGKELPRSVRAAQEIAAAKVEQKPATPPTVRPVITPRVSCTECGGEVSKTFADGHKGMCHSCYASEEESTLKGLQGGDAPFRQGVGIAPFGDSKNKTSAAPANRNDGLFDTRRATDEHTQSGKPRKRALPERSGTCPVCHCPISKQGLRLHIKAHERRGEVVKTDHIEATVKSTACSTGR